MAIHAGLKIYDALSLCVGLSFQRRSVVHCCCEAAIYCCGSCPPLGDLEGVGVGSFAEDSAASIVLLGLFMLDFAPILFELTFEVEVCWPPQLIGCLHTWYVITTKEKLAIKAHFLATSSDTPDPHVTTFVHQLNMRQVN